ncbi:MAG: hypothetical protein R3B06_31110 [Kofleriaceae bacterium]
MFATIRVAVLSSLSLLAAACVEAPPLDAPAPVERGAPAAAAPGPASADEPAVDFATFLDKVEIDTTGKTTCTNDNGPCTTADKANCPDADGKYTGACWCTHCEGGGVCETYADHQAHDDNCTIKAPAVEAAADQWLP